MSLRSMELYFFLEVIAPNGLNGINESIEAADLGLYIYHSGFNNKNILKSNSDSIIELGMETSTTDLMSGSGTIKSDMSEAKKILQKLSNIFKEAGYSHKIGIDDENGNHAFYFKHQYS